jgi:hypothetical protein
MHVHTEGKEALVPGTRKLGWLVLAGALITSACARQAVSTDVSIPGAAAPTVGAAPGAVGAASSRGAVEAFLVAVRAQDLQAMSGLWGNPKGLARDQLKREELEKRLIIMQCLMQHDKAVFAEERPRLQTGGRQDFLMTLTKGKNSASTLMTTVPGPNGRWLVEDVDVTKLRDFCT